MNAVARKPRALSQFEGMVLSAVFQAFPTFTAAALLVKLSGVSSMTSHGESVVTFIILAVLFQSIAVTCLGPHFPRFFKQAYEPLFYDATLSLGEKIARWRAAGDVAATVDDDDDVVGVGRGGDVRGVGGRGASRLVFPIHLSNSPFRHCEHDNSVARMSAAISGTVLD